MGEKERFAKMSCHDLFRVADGGEVGFLVPAQEEIEVGGDLGELVAGEAGYIRMEKGGEVHGETVIGKR